MAHDISRRPSQVGQVSSLQDDLQRVFRQVFGDADASLAGAFSPALDVEETDNEFTLHVEIPGVKPDEVSAAYNDGLLTITVPKAESAKPRRIQVASS